MRARGEHAANIKKGPACKQKQDCIIYILYIECENKYQFSFVETPRKFIIAIINLRRAATKLN